MSQAAPAPRRPPAAPRVFALRQNRFFTKINLFIGKGAKTVKNTIKYYKNNINTVHYKNGKNTIKTL